MPANKENNLKNKQRQRRQVYANRSIFIRPQQKSEKQEAQLSPRKRRSYLLIYSFKRKSAFDACLF